MNVPKYFIVHCSDSAFGNRQLINEWHLARGFSEIGYHFIILNSYPTGQSFKDHMPHPKLDGCIVEGRPETMEGAHCKGMNDESIGICCIGIDTFTSRQFESLRIQYRRMCKEYGDLIIKGHYETKSGKEQDKSCPNISGDWLRSYLNA